MIICRLFELRRDYVRNLRLEKKHNNNNNNNNNRDDIYGAVIMAKPLREFTRFI